MKRPHIILIILSVGILAFTLRKPLQKYLVAGLQTAKGRKTVQDRLEQYGQAVRKRLLPYFEAAKIPYPPKKVIFIGLKHEKILEVWACGKENRFNLIRTYPILAASGRLGPKLREGDRQVPEGLYRIESLNPNSMFHLSLRINYPNDFDREQASLENRTNLGGDIMIHGSNASIGCLAMGDEAAEDLFILVAETGIEHISVILSPVDFRNKVFPKVTYPLPEWTDILYEQIKQELSKLTDK
ncbi:MAG: L,D-transpeptidase family protein [Phycisphaerae bacterium]|nr:L,D-transpeptidase family protein [Phycisphaerae bacterium]NIP51865.1 L,D-transpeptidase family protein [Phycisphaerae bacterium]NIS54231.1 L,D-transpeptidase family protein [Phycisphaerae bacterium]NIU11856.1 L,D-transpeptidase family protein [Phycisphaerae bacterium]NIU59699.1 L,D-transpeptidase family protein [Phycisphaerae bacterium]